MVVTSRPSAWHGEHRAGFDGAAVHMDDAGAALAGVAADMRAGQVQMLAQEIDEQRAVFDFGGNGLPFTVMETTAMWKLPFKRACELAKCRHRRASVKYRQSTTPKRISRMTITRDQADDPDLRRESFAVLGVARSQSPASEVALAAFRPAGNGERLPSRQRPRRRRSG